MGKDKGAVAPTKERKTRTRKVRTFKVETTPQGKGEISPADNTTWDTICSTDSRRDAQLIVDLHRQLTAEEWFYAITEEISAGGRQIVA